MNYVTTKLVLPTNYEMISDIESKRISGGNRFIVNYDIPGNIKLFGRRFQKQIVFQKISEIITRKYSEAICTHFGRLIHSYIDNAFNYNLPQININEEIPF